MPLPDRRRSPSEQHRVEAVLLSSLLLVLIVGWAVWWIGQEPRRVALLPESRGPRTVVVPSSSDGPPPSLPLALAMATPSGSLDRPAAGSAIVVDIATPRGFWAEADGRRFFVLLSRAADPVDGLAIGDLVVISGIVKAPAAIGDVEELEEDDLSVIRGLDALLLATRVKVSPPRRAP